MDIILGMDWMTRHRVSLDISSRAVEIDSPYQGTMAEPPELFRLKCASQRYTADTNSTHFKRNNPLVCRVSAQYNHSSIGSKQVYLARRRVYNHITAHQLLIYKSLNIITHRFKLKVNLYKHCLKRQAKQLVQVHSGRKINM
jgi:hypothetical protein